MSLYDDASLIMYPSGYKEDKIYSLKPTDGSGDFNFSRASSATRVNSDGLIEDVPVNKLTYSNTFSNAAWTKTAGGSFTSGQTGYDGTNDAWQFDVTTASNSGTWQNINFSGVATFSAYFKKGTIDKIGFTNYAGSAYECWFDLTNGTIGQQTGDLIDAKIEAVGTDGWYRCSITDIGSGANYFQLKPSNAYSGVSTAGDIYIQDAQVNKGATAKTYFPTTDRLNVPRIDYTGGGCGSLLLEPQRTNLVTYSEDFSNAAWSGVNTTVTANTTISPDGTLNADTLNAGTGLGSHYYQSQSFTFATATNYTMSVFAKKSNTSTIQLIGSSTVFGSNVWASYNLDTLEVTAGTSSAASILNFGGGWYRLVLTGTTTSSNVAQSFYAVFTNNESVRVPSFTGANEAFYIYGAQLEEGSYPTSYIPTLASSVTRLADAASKTGISSLINGLSGTLFLESKSLANDGTIKYFSLNNGTTNNEIVFQYSSTSNVVGIRYIVGGIAQADSSYTIANTLQFNKFAYTWQLNKFELWFNGTKIISDTSGSVTTGFNRLDFKRSNGNIPFYSETKSLMIFPSALTDLELETLTSFSSFVEMANALKYTII